MVEENCQLFSLPISLFYAARMKFFTVNGYLRIDELIIKTGYPCFQSGEDGRTVPSRYPAGSWRERKPRSARRVGGEEARRGRGKGPGSVVSPRCVSLAFNCGCCVLFEYPSTHSSLLAVPVLWPWTGSIDLGVPLREHNRSRGSQSTTKYVLTRFVFFFFFPLLPFTSLFPLSLPFASFRLDSFRYNTNIHTHHGGNVCKRSTVT